MRTILFIPTLLALALASGAALADKSHGAVDRLRARGDVLDKSYRAVQSHAAPQRSDRVAAPARPVLDRGASRVTCSESGLDCPQRASRSMAPSEGAGQSGRAARAPTFLDKVLGSDRSNLNEAGEDQGMSGRAVKRAWSHSAPGAASAATVPLAQQQQQHSRTGEQASANRMACNDAGECMMSSKKARTQWSYSAVKAGTWQGPETRQRVAAAPDADASKSAPMVSGRPRERAARTDAPKHDNE